MHALYVVKSHGPIDTAAVWKVKSCNVAEIYET
jgi:hypothetical protein